MIQSASPAATLARSLQWLTRPAMTGTYVSAVRPAGDRTVEIVVRDPNVDGDTGMDPDSIREAHRWIADNAASILEQTVRGVRLVPVTADGYVGQPGYFSGDEQYFASNIPGVTSQAGERWNDRNGNDVEDPGEDVWQFPVESRAAATRIDRIVLDTIDDRPVEFEIEPR